MLRFAQNDMKEILMNHSAIILFAHGARDPQWAQPFEKIRALMQAQLPETEITLAFLELMQPGLADTVKNLAQQNMSRITLIPLFMAQGGHLKKDLPLMLDDIRSDNPSVKISVTPPIGEAEELLSLIAEWAVGRHKLMDSAQ
ncbi:MAG: CbiX/SirB N-terminal domain-containing protein [Burkholderiales bacterium]